MVGDCYAAGNVAARTREIVRERAVLRGCPTCGRRLAYLFRFANYLMVRCKCIQGAGKSPQGAVPAPFSGWKCLSGSGRLRGGLFVEYLEVPLSAQRGQVNVRYDSFRIVVEGYLAADVDLASAIVEVGLGQVAACFVEGDAEHRATARLGEFDQDVVAVDHFFEELQGALGAEADFDGV